MEFWVDCPAWVKGVIQDNHRKDCHDWQVNRKVRLASPEGGKTPWKMGSRGPNELGHDGIGVHECMHKQLNRPYKMGVEAGTSVDVCGDEGVSVKRMEYHVTF